MNYLQSNKNEYAYKLIGFDKDWNYVKHKRSITYTNLNPGTYTLKVKGSNNEGKWNSKCTKITIIITPPFWMTWWFRLLMISIFSFCIYTFYKLRLKNIIKRKKILEKQVEVRTHEVERQNIELKRKNNHITSSIQYAKMIQEAMLPTAKIKYGNEKIMTFYKPKDIVSGDFYWMYETHEQLIIASVDCTGHGVPGAFMSLIGSVIMESTIKIEGLTDPAEILKRLHKKIVISLHQKNSLNNDGMDLSLIVINRVSKKMTFAGARSPLVYFQGNKIQTIKGDKISIGGADNTIREFTNHYLDITESTTVYLYSDGFQDQFGGPKNKKFLIKRFKDLLTNIQTYPLEKQYTLLNSTLNEWKGDREQTDDIMVIGIQI